MLFDETKNVLQLHLYSSDKLVIRKPNYQIIFVVLMEPLECSEAAERLP